MQSDEHQSYKNSKFGSNLFHAQGIYTKNRNFFYKALCMHCHHKLMLVISHYVLMNYEIHVYTQPMWTTEAMKEMNAMMYVSVRYSSSYIL